MFPAFAGKDAPQHRDQLPPAVAFGEFVQVRESPRAGLRSDVGGDPAPARARVGVDPAGAAAERCATDDVGRSVAVLVPAVGDGVAQRVPGLSVRLEQQSAGGGLAVATAMAARERKLQMPLAVISVYPIAGTDTTTPSYVENAEAKPLSRALMSWFFYNYLNGPQDRADPRVNLVAADLKGLPPTTIINAQIDPLRSDGEMLAQKLSAASVQVQQKRGPLT